MDELEFAQRLKRYRRERGLTQQELADRIGVSNKSVSRWESGSYPDVPTLLSEPVGNAQCCEPEVYNILQGTHPMCPLRPET